MTQLCIKNSLFKLVSATVLGFATIQAATPVQATTLSGLITSGADITGMEVTVNFFDGGSETQIWSAIDKESGGVTGSDWTLFQSGDSFDQPWTFNAAQSISSLIINAIPGNAAFDTSNSPSKSGSEAGQSFFVQSGTAPTSFDYLVPIDISTGDLFGTLILDWSEGFVGELSYLADLDSGTTDDPVQPLEQIQTLNPGQTISVPEANSIFGLLAVGAFGAGSLLKRKDAQKTQF
ncbi:MULTISPECIES: hypothetical protein [unclassified Nodularia (in: cyanobacteria)]|uniref:hypothetical protein n=1 Tax=unclassified Nodularia (in: cyanobacteria) TaxID=2656917 RepID=UPI00187FBBAF|nr:MULTISPECIES: hypothetical protein [unclassified Nodularia (in: cyanobacteria)]MBE9199744.1 hypothetical protein [Nodularia sp. LEGE 06071]MCC2693354.1 hypothetical protein [Nodularia sp. LEGE 04288]